MSRSRTAFVAVLVLAAAACKRAPDPEAAIRASFVGQQATQHDAGVVWHLTSSDEVFFDDGWYPMETGKEGFHGEAWRWMGRTSLLKVRNHAMATMKLEVTGWVPLHILGAPPLVTLRWRGKRMEAFLAPPGHFTKKVLVTPEMQAGSTYADFTIETSTTGNEPGDPRDLGFALAEVRWEAAQD